jgi:hypothetical protein
MNVNGELIEGADEIEYFDLVTEAQDGKIRFGWPLDSRVTANAGKLQFAVRIFEKAWVDEYDASGKSSKVEKVIYSFNTLPATLEIKKALHP